MTLQSQPINVPVLAFDQSAPKSGGPIGRLQQSQNIQVNKRFRGQGGNAQLRIEKREGFTQFPTVVRDPASGAVSSKTMNNQTAMGTLGNRLVSFAGIASAFVLSETAACWESPTYHCPTQSLRTRTLPVVASSSFNQFNTPTQARIGTRTFYVWVTARAGANYINYMIVDDDGTMIARVLELDGSGTAVTAKAVADTSGLRFWLVYAKAGGSIIADAVDINGVFLANNSIALNSTYYDVQADPSHAASILVVQVTAAATTFDITQFDYNTGPGTVTHTTHTIATTAATNGRVQFIRNDRGSTDIYVFASTNAGPPFSYNTYEVSSGYAVTHTYVVAAGQTPEPMEVSGYVAPSGNRDLTLALGFVDTATGPGPFMFRNYTTIWTVTAAGVSTLVDTRRSLTPVSRPFQMNSTYYIVMFYQSDPVGQDTLVQSTFFLLNLTATPQICGRWEYGTAYADWQNTAGTNFYLNVGLPTVDANGGIHIALAFRARSFTARVALANVTGPTSSGDLGPWTNVPTSAIGLRDYIFGPDSGIPVEASSELLVPGPECVAWSGGQFAEDGIPLIPEIMTAQDSASAGSLLALNTYAYVATCEWTDDAGNRVLGPIGPPFARTTAAGKTAIDLTGTNIHVSRKNNLRISLYRTAIINGTQSSQHYKVISDLAPLYNVDGSISWAYTDTLSDASIVANEVCYVDKGYLDRFPAPPHRGGCATADRTFLIGYDNAIWMSGPKTEGDAWWFSPALRIPLPTGEQLTKLVLMDSFLIAFCDTSNVFALSVASLPDAAGNGPFPTPILLPFSNGCTGHAVVANDGIMFSSSQGGVWLITRALDCQYIGLPVFADVENDIPITAMAVDKNQRVFIALTGNSGLVVYDQIVKQWYEWFPTDQVQIATAHKGLLTYTSASEVWRQLPGSYSDITATGTHVAIGMSMTFGEMYFGGLRGFVRIWDAQLEGEYLGSHTLSVIGTFSAADRDTPVTGTYTFTPVAGKPYVFKLPPQQEECTNVRYQVVETPVADSPGFALEGFGFEVAVDSKLGRVANVRTIQGT